MVTIYIEGGGDSRGKQQCREGFRKLIERCGFRGRMPKLVACGNRVETYDKFRIAHSNASTDNLVMLLVDSEEPVGDMNRTWEHLKQRPDDAWTKPEGAADDIVLLMTTCMETWIVADHSALREHFGQNLQESALPPLNDLESRHRHDVQNRLQRATQHCPAPYSKGPKSFVVLGKLNPDVLAQHLPSFERTRNILSQIL